MADAVDLLDAIAGVDSRDSATLNAIRPGSDYSSFLDKKGLTGARVGIFAAVLNNTADPVE